MKDNSYNALYNSVFYLVQFLKRLMPKNIYIYLFLSKIYLEIFIQK